MSERATRLQEYGKMESMLSYHHMDRQTRQALRIMRQKPYYLQVRKEGEKNDEG